MSALKVKQIRASLLSLYEKHLDTADLSSSDPERETKVLTRCLAAFAIQDAAGCTEKEAGEAVWDGSDDNGIDGAFFDPIQSKVVLVQSKFITKGAGEPEAADVGVFLTGVRDIIEQESASFHARLGARLQAIFARMNTPGVSVELVVVSTGASKLAKHAAGRIEKLLNELNGNEPDPIASSRVIGLSEVYASLAQATRRGSVALEATIHEWAHVALPTPAYFGVIDGLTLKSWWKAHGRSIVERNIRNSLGATEVNEEIRKTALSEPENFWYFNNGITLVAQRIARAPAGASTRTAGGFSFEGASIVNGAQTMSTLSKIDDDTKLGLVRVPFRVIAIGAAPEGFGQAVTRTNNLQNRIELRDFVAQDAEQTRLRNEMWIEGIEYQYVRDAEFAQGPNSCDLIEVTTSLACGSGDIGVVVQIKTGIGRIFSDLNKAPYKALFNASLSGARAFNLVVVLREVERWIEAKKKDMQKKSGPLWGILVHGNRLIAAVVFSKIPSNEFDNPIKSFQTRIPGLDIPTLCENALTKAEVAISGNYQGKFLAVLFKNPTQTRTVFDFAKQ